MSTRKSSDPEPTDAQAASEAASGPAAADDRAAAGDGATPQAQLKTQAKAKVATGMSAARRTATAKSAATGTRAGRGRGPARPAGKARSPWLDTIEACVKDNWQAKLIALIAAVVVWYLVRANIDQDRLWLPPDFHPGAASILTSAALSDTVARSH